MFLGRGYSFPIALEGALKLKELAYVHAEGYPAGEMKHGPLALIEDGMPVVVLAPRDDFTALKKFSWALSLAPLKGSLGTQWALILALSS